MMLSLRENGLNLFYLRIVSKINVLPITVDEKSGRISKRASSSIRTKIWKCVAILSVLHSFFLFIRLVQSLLVPGYFVETHFTILCLLLGGYGFTDVTGMTLFFWDAASNVAIWNYIFDSNNTDPAEKRLRALTEYSLLELLAMFMGPMMNATCVGFTALAFFDRSGSYLLYSAVPEIFQSDALFFTLVPIDVLSFSYHAHIGYFGIIDQLFFFLKLESIGKSISDSLKRNTMPVVLKAVSDLRAFMVAIRLFNNCHAYIIFSLKLTCISVTTIGFAFGCRFLRHNLLWAVFNYMAVLDTTVVFCVLYMKAFKIPETIEKIKHQVEITSIMGSRSTNVAGGRNKFVAKVIESIPNAGIRVGSFHTFERQSTPIFIDFCVKQIASLQLALK